MRFINRTIFYQELMKSKALDGGRLLGLDVGAKYVGLAVSDPQNMIASPLSVLVRKQDNVDLMASDFEKLVSKFSLVGFVVGYPFDRGSKTHETHITAFMDAISQTGRLKNMMYTYWDETLTSKNVELLLKPLALHPVEHKSMMDKFAAADILQACLDHINRSKQ